jgi:hypothetical protein
MVKMTDREMVQFIFRRDDFRCFTCGDNILGYNKQPQRAHLLGQGKGSRRVFGDEIIDSPFNAKGVCSLKCNNKLAINHATQPIIAAQIAEAVKAEDMKTIDRLLNERRTK